MDELRGPAYDHRTRRHWSAGGTLPPRLEDVGLPARLVAPDGSVRCVAGWPEDAEVGRESDDEMAPAAP